MKQLAAPFNTGPRICKPPPTRLKNGRKEPLWISVGGLRCFVRETTDQDEVIEHQGRNELNNKRSEVDAPDVVHQRENNTQGEHLDDQAAAAVIVPRHLPCTKESK